MAWWDEVKQRWQQDNGDDNEGNTSGSGNSSDSTWTGKTTFGEFLNKVASPAVSRFSFYLSKIAGRSEDQQSQRTLTSDNQPSYSEPKLDGGSMEQQQVATDWRNQRMQQERERTDRDDENSTAHGVFAVFMSGGFLADTMSRLHEIGLVDVDPAQSFSPLSTAMLKTLGIETPNKTSGAMVGA